MSTTNGDNITIENYKNNTIKNLGKFLGKGEVNNDFPTEQEILNHQTYIHKYYENGKYDTLFSTSIYRNDKFISGITGFVENNKVLNIVTIPSEIYNEGASIIDVYYIDGTLIGNYNIKDDKIIDVQIFGDLEVEETAADQARSWWGCTKECVKDVKISCASDTHCQTMLFISDLRIRTSPGGLGTMSVYSACGISCARNKKLDLIPNN